MSLSHLSTLYRDGVMLNGPARARHSAHYAAVRAEVRTRRQERQRKA
jgi:hypothetical protein